MSEEAEVDNNYNYSKYIKTPKEMNIKVGDSLSNVENGVAGIFSYVKLLIEGKSNASKTGKPLGNKYFLRTAESCINQNTSKKEKRSLYFDNVPTGNLGILKDTGEEFSEFRGLVPGAIEDVMAIGKIDFFAAFTETGIPKCLPVKLKTIDINNKEGSDTQYVTISDVKEISPCNFIKEPNEANPKNPVTGAVCTRQGFTMQSDNTNDDKNNAELYKNYYNLDDDNEADGNNMKLMMPDDVFLKVLFYSLGALSVYVALKLLSNMYKKRE
jgi:hypothetical protein